MTEPKPVNPIFAIGHSTQPFEKFVELLKAHDIQILADIRTMPRSRRNPHFNTDFLAQELPKANIRYVHLKALGGLRRPKSDSANLGWENTSFRGYADYMQTPEFARALDELVELAHEGRTAIMCAEGNPFRCHRQLVADALTAHGIPVYHIASRKSARLHQTTPFAVITKGRVSYPAANFSTKISV